jgi:hypothetical protein
MNSRQNQLFTIPASAKPATTTGAIFSASTGMPRVFKSNVDYQPGGGMSTGAYGQRERIRAAGLAQAKLFRARRPA